MRWLLMLDLRDRGRAAGSTRATYWAAVAVGVLGLVCLVTAVIKPSWSNAALGLVILVFARVILWTSEKAREWFNRQAPRNYG